MRLKQACLLCSCERRLSHHPPVGKREWVWLQERIYLRSYNGRWWVPLHPPISKRERGRGRTVVNGMWVLVRLLLKDDIWQSSHGQKRMDTNSLTIQSKRHNVATIKMYSIMPVIKVDFLSLYTLRTILLIEVFPLFWFLILVTRSQICALFLYGKSCFKATFHYAKQRVR